MFQASQTKPSYDAAIASLSTLIPELLSMPGLPRRKFSLHEIGVLCAALGNPQAKFPCVLIAGTNGKGSTASTLASIAREAGLRVGLYTSPHLERVNERIRLLLPPSVGAPGLASETWVSAETGFPDITDIPDQAFANHYFHIHSTAEDLVAAGKLPKLPSFFEYLTALAFLHFAGSRVDLAILEVGMGGRLDATNIVEPILSVITDISLDHQEWLGNTIALIAREKAGILRPSGALVILPQHPEANQAIGEIAVQLDVRAISATPYMPSLHASSVDAYPVEVEGQTILVDSPLKGAHQHRNVALAIASAVELAQSHAFPITPSAIEMGIRNTHWPGRLESIPIPGHPPIILDVAHNPAGAWALRAALSTTAGGTTQSHEPGAPGLAFETWEGKRGGTGQTLIFACLRDKPLREMTQILFPIFDHVILAPIHSPRATEVEELLAAAAATGVPSTAASTVEEAIQLARQLHPQRIVISGSLYLVGEARTLLLQAQRDFSFVTAPATPQEIGK